MQTTIKLNTEVLDSDRNVELVEVAIWAHNLMGFHKLVIEVAILTQVDRRKTNLKYMVGSFQRSC